MACITENKNNISNLTKFWSEKKNKILPGDYGVDKLVHN
jgi:hypothetical protein